MTRTDANPDATPEAHHDPESAFALLGLPLAYPIDASRLERAWLKRSAALHPDRAGGDPETGAKLARINDAYRLLLDPERRANELLRLLGGPTKEQDTTLPDGFLMDMLEIREAHASGDPAETQRVEEWGVARRAEHENAVTEMFASLGTPPDDEDLKAIRVELNTWRYVERLLTEPGLG